LQKLGGPADWDWVQGLGALLLAAGLVGFGIVVGLSLAGQ
jgi:hypothetical protein